MQHVTITYMHFGIDLELRNEIVKYKFYILRFRLMYYVLLLQTLIDKYTCCELHNQGALGDHVL